MRYLLWVVLLATAVGGRRRHNKPGRAVLDRLASTTVSDVDTVTSAAVSGLLPAPLDVAPYSVIAANATCGEDGEEEYCRDTPGKRGTVCDICEGPDGSSFRRHPPSHALDGDTSTWWQSPTLAAGEQYKHVELITTLPDKMELLHVIIKSGPSPRPLAWSLEVSASESGEDWRMIRAYGDKDHCKKIWDLRPERRRRKARAAKRINRAHKISCSTQFANYKPLENGEMHVAVGEGVSARRVRISFRGAHPTPSRQQYYTVRSLTLAARCLCHGHAQRCAVDNKGAKCECLHATCGSHCHRCCSGGSWAPHKICDETLECLCGERGQCSFDDTGATLCLNCTENRGGPSCDKCLFGYYNTVSDGPCVPCDCDPEGSDGSCEWDNKRHRVSCNCLPGFTGHLCDSCESSNAVFPLCHDIPTEPPCKCDVRGIVDPTRECDEVCECKLNVIGERCDTCASGHFGLSSDLREGCRPCYCSHVTDICELAAPDPNTPHDIVLPLGEAWMISDSIANETLEPSLDEQGKPFVISYEVEGWENFYWLSRSFNGEQFDSYGGEIRASLFWGVVRGDSGGNPTVGPDVMLISADGRMLAYANTTHETPGQLELSVPLIEGSWYVVGDDEPCSRLQLMDALRDLRTLMIKAHFHMDQDEIRLENAEIRAPVKPVSEVCSCPAGYTGVQCSSCAWSHARILHAAGAVPPFECVPCACNEHASCDTVEGPCGSCQHNTTGAHCERCLPGHYGNPVQGACKPCACPLYLPSNNFSPNCALASAEGDEFVCTQCPDGYTGDHCENCDFGYWGSPTTPGGSCQECACGGSPCHPTTGLCLTCPPHTEGARCDLCQEGYWFGAGGWQGAGSACVECACGAGALSAACDARSGLCACRQGWAGRACDSCARGHGGLSAGCPVCRCGIAARNNICDPVSGGCLCAPGAAPPSCDNCLDEHYGLDVSGCQGCNCSSIGAEGNSCDIRTGQCRCKSHVTGRACDVCDEGYWGLDRGGCRRCECGSGASSCDPVTGVCACATGVGGVQCDRCLPGYYGFGPAGCLLCPVCSEGKVCSPTSGRCVCPGGSLGPGCKQCARGYWATSPGHCRPCACGQGALNNNCNPQSGQCKCRPGWAGLVCDVCAFGHHGPKCKPCDCNLAGSKGCSSDLCPCDNRGRCNCKENVVGEKCEKCLEGTFGLAAENPVGCTACFCFGRAAQCSQAELARAAVHAASPLHIELQRSKDNTAITTMDQDSLLAIHTHSPEATISLPWPPAPVYVELDKRFLGDRVTSYGGLIKFRIEQEGGVELDPEVKAKFPLVRIYGKNIVLDHYEHVPPLNGSYSIRLHESLWWVRGHNAQSSRAALMLALQRVDRILLRVTTRAPSYDEHVHALLLNVSLDTAIPGLSRSAPALGVEICACPRGYSASSCQEPDIGFWMPPPRVHLSTVKGTIVISLEGEAQPCHCHNRATKCDPETGYCLNCTAGTGGPRCSVCAAGFYGNPNAPAGCQPCPCPSRGKNFASDCNVAMGRVQCLCKPGYSGPRCESCAVGYRRDATGGCARCTCGRGAVSRWCDAHDTCRCRDYATGPTCDTCLAPRTYMDTDGCMPCDNCTQTLLDSIEEASSNLRKNANPAELKRIPKPFPALREFARNTTILKTAYDSLKKYLENVSGLDNSIANLEATEHRLFTEANRLKSEASRRSAEGDYLSLESVSALEDVLQLRRRLGELVEDLDEFAKGEKHLSAHRALKEARQLLKEIRNVQLTDFTASVNDVFDMANLQTTSLKEYKYRIDDTYKRVRKLGEALTEWERKAADLHRLGQAVWDAGDQLVQLQEKVKPRLAAVRDIGLRCRLILEDINSLSTNNLTDAIGAILLQSQTLAIKFPSIDAELKVLTLAAEEKEGILYSLTPAYRQKYLEPVEKHVKQLAEKAIEYKNLFAGSRAAASLGVSAAQAWSRVATLVQEASEAAEEATRAAAAASSLARGSEPMLQLAGKGKNSSEDLKMRGAAVLARAEALGVELEGLAHATDATSVTVRGAAWRVRSLGARPEARVLPVLEAASAAADRLFLTTRALYDEASDVRRLIRYHIRKQLAELQRHGDTALGAAQEHVSQIRGNTARGAEVADALAAAAAARARQHRRADRTLRPALAALRDNIERARHAADSISVSLTSSPGAPAGCSRAFPTDGASGAVTQIAIDVSFDNTVRDGPLIHLVGEIQNDVETYMKLVVAKQRLKLTWNLGGDEGLILHPQLLQSTHDDADHTSYRIEIERIWNVVELRLEQAGGAVTSARNSSARGAALRVRGLWAGDAAGGGLPACVHTLRSAGRPLGLWRGVGQPKDAACTGCTHRWMSSGRGDSMTWFDGAGYVELRRSRLRPVDRRQFSIAFTFQTRDENALLFMATDIANNRSVTIVMRECRVYFIVEYTGSRLELVAPGRHCDGRPAHLQAIRAFAANNLEKGSLRVNGEERLGSPSPPVHLPAALPDLSAATYAVGGLPPGPAAPAPPLRGCLGALSIDREGYDLLDTPTRHGVEPNCGARTIRSAIFEGSGHIELPSPVFRRKAALGISFRARAPDGLILFRAPSNLSANEVDEDGDGHFIVLALIKGELQVIASAGKSELVLRTNGTRFDDGMLHTVQIIRIHKQLELWVDDERLSSGTLLGNAFPSRPGGLYLAGVGQPDSMRMSRFPLGHFTGTLSDVIIDAQLIGLESALNWSGAQLGREDSEPRIQPRTEPRALQSQQQDNGCTKTMSYTVEAGAVKFGDGPHSHAVLRLKKRGRDIAVTLQLRTYATEGLLLLAPGSKAKPKHYIAVMLRDGKLRLVIRGRKRKEIALNTFVSDGTWRSLSIRYASGRAHVKCGGETGAGRGGRAHVAPRLYVGGLPPYSDTSDYTLPNNIVRVGGFVGCVRRVTVGGRAEDLVRDSRTHHHVGQCFPNVEPAAYFSGDAYASLRHTWGAGSGSDSVTELQLQFRTSEPNGVLFAGGDFLLEIKDATVVLSRGGEEEAGSGVRVQGGAALCDGSWHAVRAWLHARPALALDGAPRVDGPAPALLDIDDSAPQTPTDYYIGGWPEGVMESAEGGKNFKGCIRDVSIGGHKRDWNKMDTLHNVLLDSCPVQQ